VALQVNFQAYEAVFKTPLIMRGPGVPKNYTLSSPQAQPLDLLPTFLDIAGASIPDDLDGQSLLPFLTESNVANQAVCPNAGADFLIQHLGVRPSCVWCARLTCYACVFGAARAQCSSRGTSLR